MPKPCHPPSAAYSIYSHQNYLPHRLVFNYVGLILKYHRLFYQNLWGSFGCEMAHKLNICKIGNNEFTVTPHYADLMYLEVLNKSKLQEAPIVLGFPDASLNISY